MESERASETKDENEIRALLNGAIGTHRLTAAQRWIGATLFGGFTVALSFVIGLSLSDVPAALRGFTILFAAGILLFGLAAIWNDGWQVLTIDRDQIRCIAPLRSWTVAVSQVAELRIRRNRNARILVIKTRNGRRHDIAISDSLGKALGDFADM